MKRSRQIACVGAGQMATALARGLVRAAFCAADEIVAHDASQEALHRFQQQVTGSEACPSNGAAASGARIVLVAVKPHQVADVARELREVLQRQQLVVSVAAGIPLTRLAGWFGTQRVARVMPNTPCLVGCGASAYSLGPAATAEDAELVQRMMDAVGAAYQVDESLMDAVTGLSGSGPAYVYLLIEALADGGVRAGLPRPLALGLAAQTVRGAAEMVLTSGEHPAVLKDRVTSPGGTTIAGLQALEDRAVRSAAIAAVLAAAQRAAELGRGAEGPAD